MKLKTVAAGATLLALVFAPVAQAAPAKPQVTDVAGDANGINNQGVSQVPNQDMSTAPASDPAFDILSLTFAKYGKGRKGEGFTVTMALSAPPHANAALYRVRSITPTCATFWFQYSVEPTGASSTVLRHDCDVADDPLASTVNIELAPAKVDGSSVIWTVPYKSLPKQVKVGTALGNLGADNRVNTVTSAVGRGATAPQLDGVFTDATYKIGS